jgi:hypothetical protein
VFGWCGYVRVLRRIFGPKRAELEGGWRRLHNEEVHNSYALPNVIRVIKSRMRWEGHLARTGEMRNPCNIFVENVKGRGHSEDVDVDGKVLLECILVK